MLLLDSENELVPKLLVLLVLVLVFVQELCAKLLPVAKMEIAATSAR